MTEQHQPDAPVEVSAEEASTNFYWQFGNKEVFNLQSTFRGNPSNTEITEHINSVMDAMTQIVARGGHAKAIKGNEATTFVQPTTPTQAAIETGKAVLPPPSAPQGALTKSIDIIKVLPQPGDKVNIEFWQTGRKYAELYAKGWSLDRVRSLLSTVTKHDPSRPAELPIKCNVAYTLGKEYKPGKHYEDVQAIYPA
jgi:hypothetical protein